MMSDDEGIRQLGRNLFAVRVKRLSAKTGRQVNRKATVTGTKADARRVRDEIRAELASTSAQRPRIRLSAFAALWAELRAPALKSSTRRRYKYSLEHILPALGDMYLDAIAPSDIAAYIGRRERDAEGHTVLNELRCLRTMAKDAIADGYIERDFCDRVAAPKVRRYTAKRPNLLTAEQFIAVLAKIGDRWRGLVLFMVTTGLRWGEASALRWEDVDWSTNIATISRSNDRGVPTTTKTNRDRSVPVLPEVATEWGRRKKSGLVFPTRKGILHRGSPLIKVLTKACEDAKVPRVTAHGLRRTFNNLGRQLMGREVLKSITGHVTDTMVEHYSFVSTDEKSRAARVLAGVLKVGALPAPKVAN